MSAETLLLWMTHIGAGHWGMFRAAVAELYSTNEREILSRIARDMRTALSDLGHADFFVDGSRRWRTRQPALAGLECGTRALLIGGRNQALCSMLASATQREAGSLGRHPTDRRDLDRLVVTAADPKALQRVADDIGIPFFLHAGEQLAASLPELLVEVNAAPRDVEPANWDVRSWCFKTLRWVEGRLDKTARAYIDRHGTRRHMLHLGRRELRSVDRYEAVYAAACHRGHRLVRYDAVSQELSVPSRCPLPERYSRAACLASGLLPRFVDDRLVYGGVSPVLAAILVSRLGQLPVTPAR